MAFTLYANRFDTDDVIFRMAELAATVGADLGVGLALAARGRAGHRGRDGAAGPESWMMVALAAVLCSVVATIGTLRSGRPENVAAIAG